VNPIAWTWKSDRFAAKRTRGELGPTELADLPERPAGSIEELDDAHLDSVIGGLVLDFCWFVCSPPSPPYDPPGDCTKYIDGNCYI
jgi:mersacidin/lichenicidin family type 2 lantibiotic